VRHFEVRILNMRKLVIFLTLTLSIPVIGSVSAEVPFPFQKRCIVELATATWCGFCPVAERALIDLEQVYDPADVAIFALHYKDSLQSYAGNVRIDEYGADVTPIAIFNGFDYYIGGDKAAKSNYTKKIDTQLSKTSPFLIRLNGKVDKGVLYLTAYVLSWDNIPSDLYYTFLIAEESIKVDGWNYPWILRDALPKPTGESVTIGERTVTKYDLTYRLGKIDSSKVYAAFIIESFNNQGIYQMAVWHKNSLNVEDFEPPLSATLDEPPDQMKLVFPTTITPNHIGTWLLKDKDNQLVEADAEIVKNTVIIKPKKPLSKANTYILEFKPGRSSTGDNVYKLSSPAFLFFTVKPGSTTPPTPPTPPEPPKPPQPKPAKLSVDKLGIDLGFINREEPPEFSLTITNDGQEKLSGRITSDCEFVTFDKPIFDNTPVKIVGTLKKEKLHVGDYFCRIAIESNGGETVIGLKFNVLSLPPELDLEPKVLDFGSNLTQTLKLKITNSGENDFIGQIKSGQRWISIEPEIFSGDSEISVSINVVELPKLDPGKHDLEGIINVESNGGSGIVNVVARITIEKPPVIVNLFIGSTFAVVNGQTSILPAAPFLISGKTMVPMRFVIDTFGGETKWDQTTKNTTLSFKDMGVEIVIKAGQQTVKVSTRDGDKTITLAVAPMIKNGITFVPLRFFADVLGATTEWFEAEKRIKITYNP